MPPPSSKKRSAMMVVLDGDGAEDGAAGDDVGDELLRRRIAQTPHSSMSHAMAAATSGSRLARCSRARRWGCGRRSASRSSPTPVAENGGALRRFAEPERQGGRCAVGVFDEHAAGGFDALDAPAGVAEQDDVAGAGVDGEVLVERGDLHAFGLEDDVEEGGVRDGAAVGDGDHARAAARMQAAVDAVAQKVGAVAAAAGFDAFAESSVMSSSKCCAGEVAIGIGAAEDVVEGVFFPGFGAAGGDDLLHEDVDGLRRNFQLIELAGAHLADEGGLLEQVVAGGGEEAALGDGSAPVAGAAHALHGDGDGARGADLADEIDVADVDAEFERGGGDEHLDFARFSVAARRRGGALRESEP